MVAFRAKWDEIGEKIYKDADAQKIADEIESIGPSARPQQIVEKARNVETELHKVFTWDDRAAAEKYRIIEARFIVSHITISSDEQSKDSTDVKIRYFHKTADNDGYKPYRVIMASETDYKALLNRAMKDAKCFVEKYESLKEMRSVVDAIKEVIA